MIPSSNLVASQQAPLFWWKLVEKSGNRKLNWFTLYVSPWLWQRQRATHKASILLTPFLEYNIIWTTGPAAQNKLGIGLWVGIAHEFCGLWWEQFLRLTAAVTQLRKGHVWNCALFCWAPWEISCIHCRSKSCQSAGQTGVSDFLIWLKCACSRTSNQRASSCFPSQGDCCPQHNWGKSMVTLVSQGWTACSFWRISCLLAWIP